MNFQRPLLQRRLLLRQIKTEEVIQRLCRRMVHAFHLRQLLHTGRTHSVQRLERLPELLPALRTDALHVVEHGNKITLAAQLAVVGDGKAVRLVADTLDKV